MAIEMMGNYLTGMSQATGAKQITKSTGKDSLDMNDFLRLMAAQMQNQDMNNPMGESEMLAQMAQMATVTAMTNMTDVAVTTYSASLVGKEVTLASFDSKTNEVGQLVGKVTGAALYGGSQIIFVGGKSYSLSQIMAIGTLPDANEKATWVDEQGNIIAKPEKPGVDGETDKEETETEETEEIGSENP